MPSYKERSKQLVAMKLPCPSGLIFSFHSVSPIVLYSSAPQTDHFYSPVQVGHRFSRPLHSWRSRE